MPTDELLFWIAFAAASVLALVRFTWAGGVRTQGSANSDFSWAGVFACVLAAVCLRFFTLLLLL